MAGLIEENFVALAEGVVTAIAVANLVVDESGNVKDYPPALHSDVRLELVED